MSGPLPYLCTMVQYALKNLKKNYIAKACLKYKLLAQWILHEEHVKVL